MLIEFTMYGDPRAKKRHRSYYNKYIKKVMTYPDPKGQKDEDNIRMHAEKVRPEKLIEGPIHLRAYFYLPIPKSFSKKKINLAINQSIVPTTRPDLDNYIKNILDACNKIIWRDDSQIVALHSSKYYSDVPRTEIIIEEINGQINKQSSLNLKN